MKSLKWVVCVVMCCWTYSCVRQKEAEVTAHSNLRITTGSEFASLPRIVNDKAKELTASEAMLVDRTVMEADIFYKLKADAPKNSPSSVRIATWQEANPKVREFLAKQVNSPYISHFRQKCALDMICITDLMTDASEKRLPVLGEYLSMLAEDANGSVAVYYNALEILKPYVSLEERSRLASVAIREGENLIKGSAESREHIGIKGEMKDAFIKGEKEYAKYIDLLRSSHLLASKS